MDHLTQFRADWLQGNSEQISEKTDLILLLIINVTLPWWWCSCTPGLHPTSPHTQTPTSLQIPLTCQRRSGTSPAGLINLLVLMIAVMASTVSLVPAKFGLANFAFLLPGWSCMKVQVLASSLLCFIPELFKSRDFCPEKLVVPKKSTHQYIIFPPSSLQIHLPKLPPIKSAFNNLCALEYL